ncbi:MAG: UDP-N-acetylmuramoyl-tripeptide--D-alanyl-D-alanine ligase [Candidatus Staskawiczbacteria bacterium]|jgi:UDP-N-acetylmuramoyl-tripeptide--D-alanyl-D-alanine ligase
MVLSTFYILFLFWFIHLSQRIFYSIYFWQIKEYRLDRIKGDIKKSLKTLLPKTVALAIILWLFSFVYLGKEYIFLWDMLVSSVFYLLGAYSIFTLARRGWKFPKFTKKALLLLLLTFGATIYLSLLFIKNFSLFIVITEIFIAIATLLLVQILQVPTLFIKKLIYKKAREKIKKLKNLAVIGITGSYGKSSTKEFLYAFLSKKYKVLKTTGNINTEIGVAQTVLKKLKPDHEIFIVEMGAYRKGEVALLCDIVKPKIGVVTGVNEQHLSLFGSLDNLLSAEGGRELADSLPKDGKLFLNGDNKYCLDLYKKFEGSAPLGVRAKIYSLSNKLLDSDIWSDSITVHKNEVSFLAIDKSGDLAHFGANVLGKQNVQNILGAILVAKELGVNFGDISDACKKIKPNLIGATLKKGKHNIDIIDSSYSSNPDGVLADLDYLSIFSNKKIIVMPCLIELGQASSKIHEKIGKKIGQVCDLAIITNKENFKDIEKGFNSTKKNKAKCILCNNAKDAYSMITVFAKSGDAVLLEGRVPGGLIKMLTN